MTNSNENNPDDLDRDRLIDSICDRFEQDWLEGQRPQIELYLAEVHGALKQVLLVELVAIELHYRRKSGEAIAFADYQSRFPGLSLDKLMRSVDKSVQHRRTVGLNPQAGDLPTIDTGGIQPRDSQSSLRHTTIGDYRILEPIAQGGMGVVYKARQISLNRIVALKMILSGELASKQEIERFYVEARAAAMLDHPGIVPIIEVGEFEGRHFFSMAYVEGKSLSSRLSEGPMVPNEAAALIQNVTDAIQYAHDQGIIHRDLKPSNILLDLNGNPRVTDFGLAKKVSEDCGLTVSGQVLGTPSFMPPEQAAGQIDTIGPASDVYALGAVLYSLVTGRPPFQAASSMDTLRQVVEKEPVAPRQLNPAIPLDLETIVLKCLEKSVPRRYPTACALGEELLRFLKGMPIQARPVSRIEKLWRWCKRQPAVASLSAVAVLLLVGLSIGASWAYFREAEFSADLKVAFDNEKVAKDDAVEARRKADREARLADEARQEKERQAEVAARERDKAKTSEATMRRNLYISDVGRAHEAIQSSNYARAATLLERHRPTSDDQTDLRSVDWHFLQNQIVRPQTSWTFKKPVEVIAVSPDQTQVAVGCEGGRAYLVNISTGKVSDNLPFVLDEEHWSTIGFRHDGLLVAHGRSGSIKFWDVSHGRTIAHKPRDYSPQFNDYRIPAAISRDGTRMVGCDNFCLLALWNLDSLRPQQIPFVNEGLHVFGAAMPLHFSVDMTKNMQALYLDHSIAKDAGYRDFAEYLMAKHVQSLPKGYLPVGQAVGMPTLDKLQELGHPVTSMSLHENIVLLGKSSGEIELLKQPELENVIEWTRADTRRRRISSRPITSVAYLSEVNAVVATDSTSCVVLNANSLEPILTIPSSRAPFSKLSDIGQGRFAIGRRDGVVEIWSAIDERKTSELQSGTSEVTAMTALQKSASLLVSNSDGTIGLFQLPLAQNELIPSRGPIVEYQTNPSSLYWNSSTKTLAIHQSLGSQLKQFRLADRQSPQKSRTTGSTSMLITMDAFRPAIFHEQPSAKRLVGVFSQELRLIDINTLDVLRNIDITRSKNGTDVEHPVSLFKRTVNQFYSESADVSTSILLSAVKSKTFRQLEILAADDFPDEKRVVLAIGDSWDANTALRRELRLFIRDLDSDTVLSEVSFEGAQIQKSTFQIATIDNDRVIVDGVFFSDDPKTQHTLLYQITDAIVRVIDSRPVEANSRSSAIAPAPRVFNFADSHKKLLIQSPLEIRILDIQDLSTAQRLKAPDAQTFEFACLSHDGALYAVIKTSSTNFSWSTWNDTTQNWEQSFEGAVPPSIISVYQWCFDPDRSILFHLESPCEIQRWACRTGVALAPLHLPEGAVKKVVTNGADSMVAWSEFKDSTTVFSRTPPWSTSWISGNTPNHEPIQSSLYDKSPPYYLPLTPVGNCWLTSQGLKTDIKGKPPNSIINVEGKKAPWSSYEFRNSQLLLSSDSQVLVELKNDAVECWQLANTPTENLPIRFVSRGSSPLPWKLSGTGASNNSIPFSAIRQLNSVTPIFPDSMPSVSHRGKLLALVADSKVQFSIQPFKEWASIDLSVIDASQVTAITCSADEAALIVGLKDGDIVEVRIDDLSLARYPKGHLGEVTSLISMADGKTIVSGGKDGKIAIWDVGQKEMRLSIPAHRGTVNSLYWNQATEELLSGGDDGIVRKWAAVSRSTTGNVDSQFVAPNPSDPWTEIKSEVDPKVQFNREMAAQLQKRNIRFGTLNFGIRVAANSKLSVYDQLAIDEIEILPHSDLNGFDLSELRGLTELRSIKIQHPDIVSQDVTKLAGGLRSLYHLQISDINLGDLQFELVRDWQNLRVLELQNCAINDSQLKVIADLCPDLLELNLASTSVTDQSAESIGQLVKLQKLHLSNTAITDSMSPLLNKLRMIEQLDLSGTKITSEGIQQLTNLKLLRSMALRGLTVQPENVSQLWPRLSSIDIRETLATAQSVQELRKRGNVSITISPGVFEGIPEAKILAQLGSLPNQLEVDGKLMNLSAALSSLQTGSSITSIVWPSDRSQPPESADLLQSLPNLKSLTISEHAIPGTHFPPLLNLTQVTELDLSKLPSITNDQFAMLYKIPNISVVRTGSLTKETLKRLSGMPNLTTLEYKNGEDLSIVAVALSGLKQISCDNELDAAKLVKVATQLTQLESLTTRQQPTEALLKALAKLPALKRLKFQGRKLSEREIMAIKSALPGVAWE